MFEDDFGVLDEIAQKRSKSRKSLKSVINNRRVSSFDLDEVMVDEMGMEA
jgi:hypothetical protein